MTAVRAGPWDSPAVRKRIISHHQFLAATAFAAIIQVRLTPCLVLQG
jgi:hypothetical protein